MRKPSSSGGSLGTGRWAWVHSKPLAVNSWRRGPGLAMRIVGKHAGTDARRLEGEEDFTHITLCASAPSCVCAFKWFRLAGARMVGLKYAGIAADAIAPTSFRPNSMIESRISRQLVYALYVNGALLAAILVVLAGRGRGVETANAQAVPESPPIAGGGGIFVMPCQLHPDVWGCYLLDTQRETLCVYEYRAGEKALVLSAARNFRFDLDLKNYNTFPAWYDIQKAVDEAAKDQQMNESQLPSVVPKSPADNNP